MLNISELRRIGDAPWRSVSRSQFSQLLDIAEKQKRVFMQMDFIDSVVELSEHESEARKLHALIKECRELFEDVEVGDGDV